MRDGEHFVFSLRDARSNSIIRRGYFALFTGASLFGAPADIDILTSVTATAVCFVSERDVQRCASTEHRTPPAGSRVDDRRTRVRSPLNQITFLQRFARGCSPKSGSQHLRRQGPLSRSAWGFLHWTYHSHVLCCLKTAAMRLLPRTSHETCEDQNETVGVDLHSDASGKAHRWMFASNVAMPSVTISVLFGLCSPEGTIITAVRPCIFIPVSQSNMWRAAR